MELRVTTLQSCMTSAPQQQDFELCIMVSMDMKSEEHKKILVEVS